MGTGEWHAGEPTRDACGLSDEYRLLGPVELFQQQLYGFFELLVSAGA